MFRAYCVYAHTVTLEKIPVETVIFKEDTPSLQIASENVLYLLLKTPCVFGKQVYNDK